MDSHIWFPFGVSGFTSTILSLFLAYARPTCPISLSPTDRTTQTDTLPGVGFFSCKARPRLLWRIETARLQADQRLYLTYLRACTLHA